MSFRSIFSSPANSEMFESTSQFEARSIYLDAMDATSGNFYYPIKHVYSSPPDSELTQSIGITNNSFKSIYNSPIEASTLLNNKNLKLNLTNSTYETNLPNPLESISIYRKRDNYSQKSSITLSNGSEYIDVEEVGEPKVCLPKLSNKSKDTRIYFDAKFFKLIMDFENLTWKYQLTENKYENAQYNETILKVLLYFIYLLNAFKTLCIFKVILFISRHSQNRNIIYEYFKMIQ